MPKIHWFYVHFLLLCFSSICIHFTFTCCYIFQEGSRHIFFIGFGPIVGSFSEDFGTNNQKTNRHRTNTKTTQIQDFVFSKIAVYIFKTSWKSGLRDTNRFPIGLPHSYVSIHALTLSQQMRISLFFMFTSPFIFTNYHAFVSRKTYLFISHMHEHEHRIRQADPCWVSS